MAFDFAMETAVPPEAAAQRFAWEKELLGLPISVNPLELVDLPSGIPLRRLPEMRNRRVSVAGFRLPGWTGGKGWFLSDGDSFVIARGEKRPSPWEAVLVNGRYRVDAWGGGWFQVSAQFD
jgi:hypothetical protein